MATVAGSLPRFAQILQGLEPEQRKGELSKTHTDYETHRVSWEILLDGFEGSGGFLDGSYLWPFPREDEAQFVERQAQARYHNYIETLIDLYVRQLFGKGIKRTSNDEAYNAWLENVDGAGTKMDEVMKKFGAQALNGGHAGILVDKTDEPPTGPRLVDETARVFLTVYPNLAILDWRFRRNMLVGVKLLEQAPPTPLVIPEGESTDTTRYLLWDMDGWARFGMEGEFHEGDLTLTLGLVPLVVVRPKPSHVSQMLGRPLVGNANIVRAMFNRASEEDHVLRDQAFSVLTCNVPLEGSVEDAKTSLGNVIGTAKALVVKGELHYETPSMEVPQAIRDNTGYLVDELFRNAHVRRKRDSLASETAEAIRLQHTELNEMLLGFGQSMAQAEREIARCYYAWTTPTIQAAQAAFEAADPRAEYPKEFFIAELLADLEAWAAALEMDLGLTMAKRIKKRAVRRIEPDIPPDELETIDEEIDGQTEENMLAMPTDTGNPEADVDHATNGFGQPSGFGA